MNIKCLCSNSLCAALLLVLGNPAQAANWYCAHGTALTVETPANTDSIAHVGWGVDLVQKVGTFNWLHIPIPTPLQHDLKVQRVALQVYTGSNDIWISDVHVWNLANRVKELTPAGLTGEGYHTINLALDPPVPATAISYSLLLNAGLEALSHRFYLTGACALFGVDPAPTAESGANPRSRKIQPCHNKRLKLVSPAATDATSPRRGQISTNPVAKEGNHARLT